MPKTNRNAYIYRGVPKPLAPPETDVTESDQTPDTTVCTSCGARVKVLVSGKPRAHASGGFATNTRKGRFKCPGSGNDGTWKPRKK